MWEIRNHTPFSVEGCFDRDRNGSEVWCIAIKARFDILPNGLVAPSDKQPEILPAPKYIGPENNQLLSDGDFAPFREHTDVLLRGYVQPSSTDVKSLNVQFSLGNLSKVAQIFGPRAATIKNGILSLNSAEPITSCHLSWENAYGGTDSHSAEADQLMENPVGVAYTQTPFSKLPDGTTFTLPQIESPFQLYGQDNTHLKPVGFSPIQRYWLPRSSFAGTYDENWQSNRAPLMPTDLNPRFFQSAPEGQIYQNFVKGGEPVSLFGFHPEFNAEFRLPQIIFSASTTLNKRRIASRFNCTNVELFVSEGIVEMTWCSTVPCNGQDHLLEKSLVTIRQASGIA